VIPDQEAQEVQLRVNAVADIAKYSCQYDGENIPFKPTYLFQATTHSFTFTNECNIKLPVSWTFDDIKHRTATARVGTAMTRGTAPGTRGGTAAAQSPANIPCPFFVEPEEAEVAPNSTKTFKLKFQPLDADDFVYALKGMTLPSPDTPAEGEDGAAAAAAAAAADDRNGEALANYRGPVRIITRGTAKRPVCHFEMVESREYLARREPNMKNEHGLVAPIEATDLRVVSLESTGLRTRNTYRFHIINPTSENYEFMWESIGEPSAYWRCVQASGMLFGGKRVEVVFEYLPEETSTAESFFKFRLPKVGLEQIFLFSGHVTEPRVFFSTSRLDFHSVMLRGEGMSETVFLENQEHLPFNFQFDKLSLLQLDGSNGPVLDIVPKQGTVAPHGKTPIMFHFRPQEEVAYNFNIVCDVKRKPNKLSMNVKGEGYSVHPQLMLELSEEQARASASGNRYQVLKPRPAVNYADFGGVKVLDTVSKKITCANNGKYNFDYVWDIEHIGDMLALAGGKLGGTLHKGEETFYTLTFAPTKESSLDGCQLSFTVAGKYTFDIFARGVAQLPALRFAFMQYDFGNCFVTSPGGQTVIAETTLRIVNHDPTSNISVECDFQKTRALWAECPPTVLEPGATLDVQIRFAPRDVKDYTFVIPFMVNGTSKVPVTILGKGVSARLELVNASQRRLPFGNVNVGSEVRKVVPIINKSKKALPIQIVEDSQFGEGAFDDKCITVFPRNEVVIAPRESLNLQVSFAPNRRIPNFSEDIVVRYAGVMRKLVTLSGKGQGMEVSLDTDSLPFGNVVVDSAKVKKLSLENSGDMAISFSWMEASFGRHFSISPLQGKVQPNSEMTFDVTFRPQNIDDDIRQDGMILQINGMSPINLTCTGACIEQPGESTQTLDFESIARRKQEQSIKFSNPTDKDWFLTPSLDAVDWTVPNEFKVPAKGSSDLVVTYYPLTMRPKPSEPPAEGEEDPAHSGKLFVALPDGTAQLYRLKGYAGPPECSGLLEIESAAKKPANIGVKLSNWLSETQQLKVTIDLTEKPSPATFIVAANAVEIGAGSSKEFPIRFVSYTEGQTKGTITFTNPVTGEYAYYELVAKTTMPEVLEEISIESCVRQSAKYVVLLENPLPADAVVDMDCQSNDDWWTCDSDCVRVKELTPLNGNTEGSFEVEYRPLAVTEEPQEHLLSITSKDLGTYKYKLRVKATPPPLPQSLRFEVPLGSVQSESFVFKAYNGAKLDYACATKKPDLFGVEKSVTVEGAADWDGQDVRVSVSFEPIDIGVVRDTLTITAPGGVEYICDIVATCTPPMPQGPFELSQGGGNVDIPFRNYFASAETWAFSTDHAAFKAAAATAQVPAKSEGKCAVSFAPEAENTGATGSVMSAKLFVTCSSKPGLPPFVFYLKGTVTDEAAAAGKKK
jgi:hydrocephalus-inducing protein